jgi:hypothetical protein
LFGGGLNSAVWNERGRRVRKKVAILDGSCTRICEQGIEMRELQSLQLRAIQIAMPEKGVGPNQGRRISGTCGNGKCPTSGKGFLELGEVQLTNQEV